MMVLVSKSGENLHLPTVCPARILKVFGADLQETIVQRDIVALHMKHGTEETKALFENGLFIRPLVNVFNRIRFSET